MGPFPEVVLESEVRVNVKLYNDINEKHRLTMTSVNGAPHLVRIRLGDESAAPRGVYVAVVDGLQFIKSVHHASVGYNSSIETKVSVPTVDSEGRSVVLESMGLNVIDLSIQLDSTRLRTAFNVRDSELAEAASKCIRGSKPEA